MAAEHEYRALVDAIDQGFCVCEILLDTAGHPADYRFLDVNRLFEEQTGLHNAAGRTALELVPGLEHSVRPSAEGKNIAIAMTEADEPIEIDGDADRLRQVVWNLLSNAVKFTPHGGRVDVVVRRDGEAAEIEVRDTGEGIDPAFLPYVFDRFRQGGAGRQDGQGGLGLGLAVVRYMVEAHGGTVAAASGGPGRGAAFTVRVPLASRPAV